MAREDRRAFLYNCAMAAAALPLGVACSSRTAPAVVQATEWGGAAEAPADPPWSIRMAPEGEPGEEMTVSGTVYGPDGRTPAAGVLVYAYHTDATGYYTPAPGATGNGLRHGRLRGWMRTNAEGRYEFRSIRPAPYPNRVDPAHVHMTVSGPGYPEYWIDSIWFEGDPRITPEISARQLSGRGGFRPIVRLERGPDGALRGTRDIGLERV
jgi:protocatechuate 3,4-dioxygenase beta subunit